MTDTIDTISQLLARRKKSGANSPDGHTCSNIIEQIGNLSTYVRPDWATSEGQTLPGPIALQMKRLAKAAGAMQLGEDGPPGPHWIFNEGQLERFLALATAPPVPPLPY